MLLGKVLLRPQKVINSVRPRNKELDLIANLFVRLAKGLLQDNKVFLVIQEEFGVIIDQFITTNKFCLENAKNKLLGWITPFIDAFTGICSNFKGNTTEEILSSLLEILGSLLGNLSLDKIKETVERLFTIIGDDLGEVIGSMPGALLIPCLDRVVLRLQEDYNNGVNDNNAQNRFFLAKDIQHLYRFLMNKPGNSVFSLNKIKNTLLNQLDKIPFNDILKGISPLVQSAKDISSLIIPLFKKDYPVSPDGGQVKSRPADRFAKASVSLASKGIDDGYYLWYASWLTGHDYWRKGKKIYKKECELLEGSPLNSSLEEDLDQQTFSPALHDEFLTRFNIDLADFTSPVEQNTPGSFWVFHDYKQPDKKDRSFSVIKEDGELNVYRGVIAYEDWTEIEEIKNFTYRKFESGTMNEIAFHTSWMTDLLVCIPHIASMVIQRRHWTHILNIAASLVLSAIKTMGPSGSREITKDLPFSGRYWLRWVVPVSVTFLGSFDGLYTKDEAGHGFLHWLYTLLGYDMTQMFLFDHWTWLLREFILSLFTLINYKGPRTRPGNEGDTWALNRKKIDGVVNLFTEAGIWVMTAVFPKKDFGILSGTTYLHWLLFDSLMAAASGFAGSICAYLVCKCFDWGNLKRTLPVSILFAAIKYLPYYYIFLDGDTDKGTFDGKGTGFPGYQDKGNSPYRLPYKGGSKFRCVQGNMGIWSHTPHSNKAQIYGFDFDMDKGDGVEASREGTIDGFYEDYSDHSKGGWNYIRIRHSAVHSHDRDADKRQVITYMEYGHGINKCVTNAYGGTTPAAGDNVTQGQKIMLAGDTGMSAYNHLHVHIKPQRLFGSLYAGASGAGNMVLRWTGRGQWTRVGGDFDGRIHCIAVDPNTDDFFAGGDFTRAGTGDAYRIAKWNSTAKDWEALGAGLNGVVRALFLYNNALYAGGDFTATNTGSTTLNHFAVWDISTSTWSQLGGGFNNNVHCIFVNSAGLIYTGGEFTMAGGNHVAVWNSGAATWIPVGAGLDNTVRALTEDTTTSNIYAGGDFTNHIARWNGVSWNALGSGLGGGIVRTLVFDSIRHSQLYAGGDFMTADGDSVNHIARWDTASNTWSALGNGFNGIVNTIVLLTDTLDAFLYVGGDFTSTIDMETNYNSFWNSSNWTHLARGADYPVTCLALKGYPGVGDYTVPFVFSDVEGDGVCKAMRMYESGNL